MLLFCHFTFRIILFKRCQCFSSLLFSSLLFSSLLFSSLLFSSLLFYSLLFSSLLFSSLLFSLPNPLAASDCPVGRPTDSRRRGFETLLPRSTPSTEKAAEVSRECPDEYGHSLDWQAVSGRDLFLVPSGSPMDEPHHPDQDGRCAPHHQMR